MLWSGVTQLLKVLANEGETGSSPFNSELNAATLNFDGCWLKTLTFWHFSSLVFITNNINNRNPSRFESGLVYLARVTGASESWLSRNCTIILSWNVVNHIHLILSKLCIETHTISVNLSHNTTRFSWNPLDQFLLVSEFSTRQLCCDFFNLFA